MTECIGSSFKIHLEHAVGLQEDMIELIIACTSKVTSSILWNGSETKEFKQTRR